MPTCEEYASMGPRLKSRGKGDLPGAGQGGQGASMGPRLKSRGKQAPGSRLRAHCCFNGAAAEEPRKGVVAADLRETRLLQWGRG